MSPTHNETGHFSYAFHRYDPPLLLQRSELSADQIPELPEPYPVDSPCRNDTPFRYYTRHRYRFPKDRELHRLMHPLFSHEHCKLFPAAVIQRIGSMIGIEYVIFNTPMLEPFSPADNFYSNSILLNIDTGGEQKEILMDFTRSPGFFLAPQNLPVLLL